MAELIVPVQATGEHVRDVKLYVDGNEVMCFVGGCVHDSFKPEVLEQFLTLHGEYGDRATYVIGRFTTGTILPGR